MSAGGEMLRPAEAAKRFGISADTLYRWARAGLIGRSQVSHNLVFYSASDIADVVRAQTVSRTVVPLSPEVAAQHAVNADDSWRDSPLWRGTEVAR